MHRVFGKGTASKLRTDFSAKFHTIPQFYNFLRAVKVGMSVTNHKQCFFSKVLEGRHIQNVFLIQKHNQHCRNPMFTENNHNWHCEYFCSGVTNGICLRGDLPKTATLFP